MLNRELQETSFITRKYNVHKHLQRASIAFWLCVPYTHSRYIKPHIHTIQEDWDFYVPFVAFVLIYYQHRFLVLDFYTEEEEQKKNATENICFAPPHNTQTSFIYLHSECLTPEKDDFRQFFITFIVYIDLNERVEWVGD